MESIKKAIDEAELTAGVEIDSGPPGLSGAHVKAFNSRGVVAVAGRTARSPRRRAPGDRGGQAVVLPSGRRSCVLPQDFVVDEQDGIGAPVGMTGSRLEANVHVVTGSASSTQNMVACVNRAGVAVVDTVLEQLAASEAVLTRTRRSSASRWSTLAAAPPIRDLRARQPVAHWRRPGRRRSLHQRHRGRPAHPDPRRREDQAPLRLRAVLDGRRGRDDGSRERRRPQAARDGRRILSEILQPRAEEIFHLLWDEIRKAGFEKSLNSGIVLTGGGAMLEGVRRSPSKSSTADPARVAGRCRRVGRSRRQPGIRDRVGVVMYAHRNQAGELGRRLTVPTFGRVAGRLRGLFKEFL